MTQLYLRLVGGQNQSPGDASATVPGQSYQDHHHEQCI